MQEQKQTLSDFSERTDALARALGRPLRELAPEVGISPAMFFAYRSGKSPISPKAWRKLEQAEVRAGLRPRPSDRAGPTVSTAAEELRAAPQWERFRAYLDFVRGCREEAERLSGGDRETTIALFDRMLAAYVRTTAPEITEAEHAEALQKAIEAERRKAG